LSINGLDKFDVDSEVFFNKYLLRMNDENNFQRTVRLFAKYKPACVPYILEKFRKKKCSCCDGSGYLDDVSL